MNQLFGLQHRGGLAPLRPFEGQFAIGPERIDDPDVLVKYLSWFHDCKVKKKSPNLQILLKKIGSCLCCMLHVAKSILKNRCRKEKCIIINLIYIIYIL